SACVLNQNPPHRFRGRAEEMASPVPLSVSASNQPHPGFVHQCGRLKSMARGLLRHLCSRKPAQLIVNQWEQFFGGLRIPVFNRIQHASDVAHRSTIGDIPYFTMPNTAYSSYRSSSLNASRLLQLCNLLFARDGFSRIWLFDIQTNMYALN